MARHPTARKAHRDRAVNPDDVFVEKVLETSAWAKHNQRLITFGIITAAVVLLGGWWYRNNQQRIRDQAAIEILQVRQTAQSGNPALTIRDAEAFIDRFGDAAAAIEARLILGQAYLESNQPQQAIDAVSGLAGDLDTPSGVSAAMLTAAAHESATRLDEAERVLLRVADGAPFDYQKLAALDNGARIRFERGNPAGAAELYGRILDLLPDDSQDRPVFVMRRAEALAAAAGATN